LLHELPLSNAKVDEPVLMNIFTAKGGSCIIRVYKLANAQ
jgi:hypothetical protein